MPAEQALTEARKRAGPSYGGGGGADAFRARLEEWTALIAPAVLILALALAGGGYETTPRHIAGLAVWLVVVALLAMGRASQASVAKPFYWGSGLILALAVFSALSSLWSGSAEISVTEADRVLVYLGVFVAAFLIAQTDEARERFGEGLAIALIGIAVLALGNRLLPHVFDVHAGLGSGYRIRYPLGYWNANGVACGIGFALAMWMSRNSPRAFLRWLAVAAMPVLLTALYLTYSRGAILALLVAGGCLVALSRDRLWLLGTFGVGVVSTLPAVIAIQARPDVANNWDAPGVIGAGVAVALYVLAGAALALLLWRGMRALERRGGALTGRALALSRDRRVLRGAAVVAAVVAVGAAVFVGERASDQFSSSDIITAPENPSERLQSISASGRGDFYRVALDALGEEPLFGHGAGTYQFAWYRLREIDQPVHDAHSLYLEAFAELGVVGGALVLAMVLSLLWAGFSAWRAARASRRDLYAALLAASLAFAVGAAIDWLWEIAALGCVFFLASGALVAGRCAQLRRRRAGANGLAPRRRYGLAVTGLAIAWLTALALIGPLLVDRELNASRAAAGDEDFAAAVSHADTARSIEPWAATPYIQLGLLAQAQGDYDTAVRRLGQAIDREDGNWVLYYLRAKAEHEAGEEGAAARDLRKARELNPLEACLREGWEGCG